MARRMMLGEKCLCAKMKRKEVESEVHLEMESRNGVTGTQKEDQNVNQNVSQDDVLVTESIKRTLLIYLAMFGNKF
jgi:hypothetical protein